MIEGRLEELPQLLQGVIEDERTLIATLRDNGGDQLLLARGRLEAWMAIHRHLTEYGNSLRNYRKDQR